MNLNKAFRRFFDNPNVGFPNFKSKKNSNNSYKTMTHRGYKVSEDDIVIAKLGSVKIKNHRHLTGVAKSCIVSMTPTYEFYISILWKENKINENLAVSNNRIGIDLGLIDLVTCSNGDKFPVLHALRKNLNKLKLEQRKLSRMVVGSKNYERQRLRIAYLHQHISNQRKDYLHKISFKLVNENQVIFLEDLDIKGMLKNKYLSLSVSDAGWGQLIEMLKYKAERKGRIVYKIDRWYPSSQLCSCCGYNDGKKPLNVRMWTCPNCGIIHDRDINAAKNILTEGNRILGACASPDR